MLLHTQSLCLSYYAILPLLRLTSSVLLPSRNVSLESGLGHAELVEPGGVQ